MTHLYNMIVTSEQLKKRWTIDTQKKMEVRYKLVHSVWFHWKEVEEEVKLIYGDGNQRMWSGHQPEGYTRETCGVMEDSTFWQGVWLLRHVCFSELFVHLSYHYA